MIAISKETGKIVIDGRFPAGTLEYKTRDENESATNNRWEFEGTFAHEIRGKIKHIQIKLKIIKYRTSLDPAPSLPG